MKSKRAEMKSNIRKVAQYENKKRQRLLLMFYIFSFFFVGTTARADLVDTLGNALTYMTGPFGKVIAGLAIAGVGYLYRSVKLDKKMNAVRYLPNTTERYHEQEETRSRFSV